MARSGVTRMWWDTFVSGLAVDRSMWNLQCQRPSALGLDGQRTSQHDATSQFLVHLPPITRTLKSHWARKVFLEIADVVSLRSFTWGNATHNHFPNGPKLACRGVKHLIHCFLSMAGADGSKLTGLKVSLSMFLERIVCELRPLACCKDWESEAQWPHCYDQEVHQGLLVGEGNLPDRESASGPRAWGHTA